MRIVHNVVFVVLSAAALCCGEELPVVSGVEFQPLAAQVSRLLQALDLIGEPLPAEDTRQLRQLVEGSSSTKSVGEIQRILDRHCLAGIDINPESRVKVQQGQA